MKIKAVWVVCDSAMAAARLATEYEYIGRETRRNGRFLRLLTR